MKYLLLILFLIPFCAFAQTKDSSVVAEQEIDSRIFFQSKVRQLNNYLNENNESAARQLFKDVSADMQAYINTTKTSLDTASITTKKKLERKLEHQKQLFMQFQSFESHLIRNRSSIQTWSEQFTKTLYEGR